MRKFIDIIAEASVHDYAYNSSLNYFLKNGDNLTGKNKEIHDFLINHPGDVVLHSIYHSGISPEFAEKIANSNEIYSPAHISTSSDEKIAKEYAERRSGFRSSNDAHIVHFHLPKDYKNGINISGFGDEKEYLLKSGQTFKHVNPYSKINTERDKYGRNIHHYNLMPK